MGSINSFAGIRAVTRKNKYIGSQPSPGTESRHSLGRNTEIRQQPVRIVRGCASQLPDNSGQLRFSKAIEKEMRYDQVVRRFGRSPRHDVLMEESHALCAVGQFTFDALPRQLQHPLTGIEAIDLHFRMKPQQFAKEPPVPLAHDQRTPRCGDFAQASDATALEIITKGDPLQRPIPRRQRVEAHAFMTSSASNGVSKTRSASAVRSSRPILPAQGFEQGQKKRAHTHAPENGRSVAKQDR